MDEPVDEKFEDKISKLKEQLIALTQEMSNERKRGNDVDLIAVKLMNVKSKIMMAAATKEEKDIMTVKEIYDEVTENLAESRKEFEIEQSKFKEFEAFDEEAVQEETEQNEKDINETKKIISKDPDMDANQIIKKINILLKLNKVEEAKNTYIQLQNEYKSLPPERKKEILPECIEIQKRLI